MTLPIVGSTASFSGILELTITTVRMRTEFCCAGEFPEILRFASSQEHPVHASEKVRMDTSTSGRGMVWGKLCQITLSSLFVNPAPRRRTLSCRDDKAAGISMCLLSWTLSCPQDTIPRSKSVRLGLRHTSGPPLRLRNQAAASLPGHALWDTRCSFKPVPKKVTEQSRYIVTVAHAIQTQAPSITWTHLNQWKERWLRARPLDCLFYPIRRANGLNSNDLSDSQVLDFNRCINKSSSKNNDCSNMGYSGTPNPRAKTP